MKKLLLLALVAALIIPMVGCSDDDDDPPPPPPPWGPGAVAVGDAMTGGDPLIMTTGDMLNWTQVPAATHGITSGADLTKVVKVPGVSRWVVVASVTGEHDQIWYADDPAGAWTQASFDDTGTPAEDGLDVEHRNATTGTYDEWSINDMFFVNATDGYAVGDNYIVLRTWDGGATWKDMNTYGDTAIERWDIGPGTGSIGTFTTGMSLGNAASSPTATATVISYEYYSSTDGYLVVHVDTGTWASSDYFYDGSTEMGDIDSISTVNRWTYGTYSLYSVYAIEDATGVQTIWFGSSSGASLNGVWTLTSDTTAGATRTFTWAFPVVEIQDNYGTDILGDNSIYALFFFDTNTGVAGTSDGVYNFESGTWATTAAVDTGYDSIRAFGWSRDTKSESGFLYVIPYSTTSGTEPSRLAVTYTAPSTWAFDTAGWLTHADPSPGFVDLNYSDWGVTDIIYYGGNMFALARNYSDGQIAWGENVNTADNLQATFDATYWQDSGEQYMGGDSTAPENANWNKEIWTGTTTEYIRSMCKR